MTGSSFTEQEINNINIIFEDNNADVTNIRTDNYTGCDIFFDNFIDNNANDEDNVMDIRHSNDISKDADIISDGFNGEKHPQTNELSKSEIAKISDQLNKVLSAPAKVVVNFTKALGGLLKLFGKNVNKAIPETIDIARNVLIAPVSLSVNLHYDSQVRTILTPNAAIMQFNHDF